MDFFPSRADPDIWMREQDAYYEYIAVYVDDLAIAAKDCATICRQLKEIHGFKLKGDGPLRYHLGCDYSRDKDGTLCSGPIRYIEKMLATYQRLYGEQPKTYKTPLEPGDHPEIDDTTLCNDKGMSEYQTLIGQLQWLISLGRFDVFTATMSMSRFRVAPKVGHLDRVKRMYGFIRGRRDGKIRHRTEEADFSNLSAQEFEWEHSVYGKVREMVPKDAPRPRGKPVQLVTYVDANLYHDLVTGRSVTAVLHLINKTPFDWHSKRQATVENATFGSEFVAARTAIDQIIDIRLSLRYLGVPIKGRTVMFGDNQSVVKNSTVPHSVLNKRHIALSYHRVREALAAKIVSFHWIDGKRNPADLLSKHWDFVTAWPLLKPLLFWAGDTSICRDEVSQKKESKKKKLHKTSNGE